MLLDDFGVASSEDDDDTNNQTPVTVDACLATMATYVETRRKATLRCLKLQQSLRQFETLLGFTQPLVTASDLNELTPAHRVTVLQQHVAFCEAIVAQRVLKRLQSWHDAHPDDTSRMLDHTFLACEQVDACRAWLIETNLFDRAYFQTRVLPLVLNGWISVTPSDLEAEDAWLAL